MVWVGAATHAAELYERWKNFVILKLETIFQNSELSSPIYLLAALSLNRINTA